MKPAELIADSLLAEDVRVVFTLADEVTVFLVQALRERGVRIVHVRHEQNAVLMADGYFRATGRVGICIVGHGPAIAQTGTALVTARKRGSHILILTGRASTNARRGEPKEFDEGRFVESTGNEFLRTPTPRRVGEALAESFRMAQLHPVVLQLPDRRDLLTDQENLEPYHPPTRPMRTSDGIPPDQQVIEDLAARLMNARRPIILAGRGAHASRARDDILRLADLSGSLLCTSLQARELFRGHPRDIGIVGTFATEPTATLLPECDLALVLGASLNPNQTGGDRLVPRATIVQVDVDPSRIGALSPVDVGIVGDVGAVVRAVTNALEFAGIDVGAKGWENDRFSRLVKASSAKPAPSGPECAPDRALTGSAFLAAMNGILPEDRFVVVDAGFFMNFVVDQVDVPGPDSWLWSLDFASIGLGLSMGIGAAIGRPEKRCALFVGDGGLAMSLQELDTAARERVPLVIIVMNNGTYMSEVLALRSAGLPEDVVGLGQLNFAGVAAGFGIPAVTVRSLLDLEQVGERIANARGPLLIDARVDEDEAHRQLARYV